MPPESQSTGGLTGNKAYDEPWLDGYQGALDNLEFIAVHVRPEMGVDIATLTEMLKNMAPKGL